MSEALPPAILWIDGVGGFLLLRNDSITLGPAYAEPAPDVPILADISRNHATISRDSEGYWLRADRPTAVNQATVQQALLKDEDRITLGASCQLLFRRPEPLSASARISVSSGHRFAHPVDAVLLMADALTLDRTAHAHIQVLDLEKRIVIVRQGIDLVLKASTSIRSSGQASSGRVMLKPGEPTTVEDVTLTLESIG